MKRTLLVMVAVAGMLSGGLVSAEGGADLAKAKNCMNCHDMDKKKVGPSFKDVAAKYKDNKEAEATVTAKLKEGKGHPVKVVGTDAELKTLVQYSLTGK